MITSSQVANHDGEFWTIRYDQSPLLTTIGGYLLLLDDIGLMTISAHLSPEDQAQCRNTLLKRLAETPLGTVRAIYWTPEH